MFTTDIWFNYCLLCFNNWKFEQYRACCRLRQNIDFAVMKLDLWFFQQGGQIMGKNEKMAAKSFNIKNELHKKFNLAMKIDMTNRCHYTECFVLFLLWYSMWRHYICSGHWHNYFLQPGQLVQASVSLSLMSPKKNWHYRSIFNFSLEFYLLLAQKFKTSPTRRRLGLFSDWCNLNNSMDCKIIFDDINKMNTF